MAPSRVALREPQSASPIVDVEETLIERPRRGVAMNEPHASVPTLAAAVAGLSMRALGSGGWSTGFRPDTAALALGRRRDAADLATSSNERSVNA